MMKYVLRAQLDPRGLRVLKKRLLAGEITPKVYKDILKRQMVKQYFQNYVPPLTRFKDHMKGTIRSGFRLKSNQQGVASGEFPRIELEELFAMHRSKRI